MVITEKNPANALLPREHSERKKCQQRRHPEPCRGPAQENPCHQECSKHRQVSCNRCRHQSIVAYANSFINGLDLLGFVWQRRPRALAATVFRNRTSRGRRGCSGGGEREYLLRHFLRSMALRMTRSLR